MTAIALTHRDQIISGLLSGKRLSDLAQELGISHQAISKQLKDDEDYIAAMDASLDVRMDQREDELEQASDQVAVARARELLSHARFRAERLAPQRWGKQPDAPTVSLNLNLSTSTLTRASDLLNTIQSVAVKQLPDHDQGGGDNLPCEDEQPPVV